MKRPLKKMPQGIKRAVILGLIIRLVLSPFSTGVLARKPRLIFLLLILNVIVFGLGEHTGAKEREFVTDVSLTTAINLTGEWRFKKIGFIDESMVQPEYDDSTWPTVQTPAPWEEQGIEWQIGDIPVVLYRRTITVPAEWEGQPIGISCWFSNQSVVYVNGIKVDPTGPLFARYGDVSKLLRYGETNYIAVTALNEGKLVLAEGGPPRLGILEKRLVTKVLREDITIPSDGRRIDVIIFRPAGVKKLPGLILIASGHHACWGVTEQWFDFADELAREGYASLVLGATTPGLEHIPNAVDYLSTLDFIDPGRIGVIGADIAAMFSLVAASRDSRIKTVIVMSVMPSMMVGLDEKASLGPALLIVSKNDRKAVRHAKQIMKLLVGTTELLVFKGKVHGISFMEEKWSATTQAILDWLKRYL